MLYIGGGFVADGGAGYETGDDVVEDYDAYDWEFDLPLPPEPGAEPDIDTEEEEGPPSSAPSGGGAKPPTVTRGEPPIRREDRSREFPQFGKRYNVEPDLDKLKESLEWAVSQSDSPGAVRWDDIYDAAGEVAGVGFWIGFGPDVGELAIQEILYEALSMAGLDVSQTLIAAANLRRGLERDGAVIKQAFYRIFIPSPGWKMLSDWTILREGEKKSDLHPELQAMVRERQAARRLEIIEKLKDVRVAEVRAAELARERAAREEAERRAAEAEAKLKAQIASEPPPVPPAPPAPHEPAPPAGWKAAVERSRAGKVETPIAPPPARAPAAKPTKAKPAKLSAEARREARKIEAQRLSRRARYLEDKAGKSRSKAAIEARREAKVLRAKAEKTRPKARKRK